MVKRLSFLFCSAIGQPIKIQSTDSLTLTCNLKPPCCLRLRVIEIDRASLDENLATNQLNATFYALGFMTAGAINQEAYDIPTASYPLFFLFDNLAASLTHNAKQPKVGQLLKRMFT